jgi:hypothetical protein
MQTVEQIRNSLHSSLQGQFEDAVQAVIEDVVERGMWREWNVSASRHIARERARQIAIDAIWDMEIEMFLDVADAEIAAVVADILH